MWKGEISVESYSPVRDFMKQAAKARNRARKRGLFADLSGEEWIRTMIDFEYECAYCGDPALTLDHFIPLSDPAGPGTTIDNCVPCCLRCNHDKAGLHPNQVQLIPTEAIERVRHYLSTRHSSDHPEPEPLFRRRWRSIQTEPLLPTHSEHLRMKGYSMIQERFSQKLTNSLTTLRLTKNNDDVILYIDQPGNEQSRISGFQIPVTLTPLECTHLAIHLLSLAVPQLEKAIDTVNQVKSLTTASPSYIHIPQANGWE